MNDWQQTGMHCNCERLLDLVKHCPIVADVS
jgi:hypothetical protein